MNTVEFVVLLKIRTSAKKETNFKTQQNYNIVHLANNKNTKQLASFRNLIYNSWTKLLNLTDNDNRLVDFKFLFFLYQKQVRKH